MPASPAQAKPTPPTDIANGAAASHGNGAENDGRHYAQAVLSRTELGQVSQVGFDRVALAVVDRPWP